MFEEWMKIAINLSECGYSTVGVQCPECEEEAVEYVYAASLGIGYLSIWCNKCLQGIQLSRVSVPEGARVIDMYNKESVAETIPCYKLIHRKR